MHPEDMEEQRRAGEQRRIARAVAEEAMLNAMTAKLDVPLIGKVAEVKDGTLVTDNADGMGLVLHLADDDDGSREWAFRQAMDEANAELPIQNQVVTVTVVASIWKIDQLVNAMNHTFDHDCQHGQMLINELAVMVVSELEELGTQLVIDWRSGDGSPEAEGED